MKKSYESPEEHIKDLYTRKAKNDENSTTLAHTLESNIETAFKGEHKFIYELLQNADDAAEKNKKNIAVKLVLVKGKSGSYFILSHSGKHFDEIDAEKICNNAQNKFQEKSEDSEKIGYKGIGFKAVFSVADIVYILSKGYQFRFDKSCWERKKDALYPWPIIPIWTESKNIPNVKNFVRPEDVTFVFKIKEDVDIENEINFIKNNPTVMLFLRRVNSIEIKSGKEEIKIDLRENSDRKEIYCNNKLVSSWITHSIEFELSKDIKEELMKLSDSECPQRLKNANKTKITFVAQVQDGKIIRLQESQLYCYLPTQANYGFPYIVNADFLLTADRTKLIGNKWNEFLMRKIAYAQFIWLAELTKNPDYVLQIFQLLTISEIKGHEILRKAYAEGYQQAIESIRFIPSYGKNLTLLLVNEVIVDETKFCHGLSSTECSFKDLKLISDKFANIKIFIKFFGEKIGRHINGKNLNKIIVEVATKNPSIDLQKYILSFLQEFGGEVEDLNDKKFLLATNGELASPGSLYFKTEGLAAIDKFICLNIINDELLKYEKILKILGVSKAEPIKIIRNIIENLIEKNGINLNNYLELTRYIFQWRETLTEKDWLKLRFLPVMTIKGKFKPAYECYCSDHYQPHLFLEKVLTEVDIFISEKYLQENDAIASWLGFFEQIGAKNDIKVRTKEYRFDNDSFKEEYIDDYVVYTKIGPEKKTDNSKHHISNILAMDLTRYASNPKFIDIFLQKMINQWQDIKNSLESPTIYVMSKKNKTDISYLQYCLQNKILIPANREGKYLSRQLFTPNLYSVCGEAFPVAKLNVVLTKEQSLFVGFKDSLTVDDCLKVLNELNKSKEQKPERYEAILRYLLTLSLTEQEIKRLVNWQGKLLAQDNSLQPIKKLKFYKVTNIEPPHDAGWLKNFPNLHFNEMEKIVALLGIASIDEKSVKISPLHENMSNSNAAKEKIFKCLNILAVIQAVQLNSDAKNELEMFLKKFWGLKFYSTNRFTIEINGQNNSNITAYIVDNCLYFKKRHDSATCEDFCNALGAYLGLCSKAVKSLKELMNADDEEIDDYLLDHQINKELVNSFSGMILDKGVKEEITPIKIAPIIVKSQSSEITQDVIIEPEKFGDESHDIIDPEEKILFDTPEPKLSSGGKIKNKFIDSTKVNISAIEVRKMTPQKRTVIRTSQGYTVGIEKEEETLTRKERQIVGRIGEKIVYDKLVSDYKIKYSACFFADTTTGFKLSKESSQEKFELEVIWHNKGVPDDKDSGQPKDFTITKTGKEPRYIEVKTTPHATKKTFHISSNEFELMKNTGDRYRIFRVFGGGTEKPTIGKLKNPAKEIEDGNIEIKTYEIKF